MLLWIWLFILFLLLLSVSILCLYVTPRTVAGQAPFSMGFFQARLLEWVAIPFFRGSFWPRGWTRHLLHWQMGSLPLSNQSSTYKCYHPVFTFVRFISLRITPSRSTYVFTNGRISFFLAVKWYSIVYIYHILFIHSSADRHLSCFHI